MKRYTPKESDPYIQEEKSVCFSCGKDIEPGSIGVRRASDKRRRHVGCPPKQIVSRIPTAEDEEATRQMQRQAAEEIAGSASAKRMRGGKHTGKAGPDPT